MTAAVIPRQKFTDKWKAWAVGISVVGIALLFPYLYEPFRIPDYLDRVLFQTSYSGTAEETIELLNENSVYDKDWSDPNSPVIATGLKFSGSGSVLVIEHPRLSASVVSKIHRRIQNDEEFLWWKLSPEKLKQRLMDRGGDTPSWQDAVTGLSRLGFSTMRFTNGVKSWVIPLRGVNSPIA